jgi:hypothetical protein
MLRRVILTAALCLPATSLPADFLDDVVYGRISSSHQVELFRNDGTTMQQAAGPNSPTAGVDDGIYGMVATADGNVVVARLYEPANASPPGFDLLSFRGDTLVELGRTAQNAAGVDDGLFSMVAAADGSVVMARTYDPAGPGAGEGLGFDLLRYDPTVDPIENLNRSAQNVATVDDGLFGMVAASDGTVVMARTYDPAGPGSGPAPGFDLLRFDLEPAADNPGFPGIVNLNRSAQNVATVDDGLFGMVATADAHVVMARTYDPSGPDAEPPLGFHLLRYDLAQTPCEAGFPNIVEVNRSVQNVATVDDGLLGMVATRAGDVVMVREYAGQWDLLRYDVTADPILELNSNTAVEGLENGILGVVALGNGGFAIARQGAGGTIDLFAYDGTTLAETGNNLTDPNRQALENGFIGIDGFSFDFDDPGSTNFEWNTDLVGNWNDADNWDPNTGPPAAEDSAQIDSDGAHVSVDNEAASCTAVTAGELSVEASGSLFSTVSLTGGALSGDGTVIGSVTNSGGTLSPGSDGGANVASDFSTTVPEPASGVLLGMALTAFWVANRLSQKG